MSKSVSKLKLSGAVGVSLDGDFFAMNSIYNQLLRDNQKKIFGVLLG